MRLHGRFVLVVSLLSVPGQLPAVQDTPIRLRLDVAEAEAALAILDARAAGAVPESLWTRLELTEGYRRLADRERAMGREMSVAEFRAFLSQDSMVPQRGPLRRTLRAWSTMPVTDVGARALAYLPAGTPLEATVYLLIKPRQNSFVYDLQGRPAIMLYLDPGKTPAQFANTAAHELHHIGLAAACRATTPSAASDTSAAAETARSWLSAFGEGLAMLAAAGGPAVHPHQDSPREDRDRWDRDMLAAGSQMREVEAFFLDLLEGRLSEEGETSRRGMEFFGVQGPWYTVGYRMWSTVERTYGRRRVIEDACDPARLLLDYTRAVAGDPAAPRWSVRFTDRLPALLLDPLAGSRGSGEPESLEHGGH
jgi:hypothetical protein